MSQSWIGGVRLRLSLRHCSLAVWKTSRPSLLVHHLLAGLAALVELSFGFVAPSSLGWQSTRDRSAVSSLRRCVLPLIPPTIDRRRWRASAQPTPLVGVTDSAQLARLEAMKEAASRNVPFTDDELGNVLLSLQTLAPPDNAIDWGGLRSLLSASAHLSHKDWAWTQATAQKLSELLGGPDDAAFRTIFSRVLGEAHALLHALYHPLTHSRAPGDGGWDVAASATAARPAAFQPWVVLVTGVNGIRKTSSVYQPWFKVS